MLGVVIMGTTVTPLPAVSAVHEQVNDRAEQQQCVRQRAEHMRPVLGHEEKGCDGNEDAESQPHWDAKGLAFSTRAGVTIHGIPKV